ncbi:hypothetical protein HYR69_10485 [Candidatus Sumerlaeota bacterium]|nr:hypothetical protein [Candidatus Sumerlaeota bacterium]
MNRKHQIGFRRWRVILISLALLVAFLGLDAYITTSPFSYRSHVSVVKADLRSLGTALEAYFADHGTYPAQRPLRNLSLYPDKLKRAGGWELMTVEPGLGDQLHGTTTPVAYIEKIPQDLFTRAPRKQPFFRWLFNCDSPYAGYYYKSVESYSPFAYFTDGKGWILFSPGRDTIYDINPAIDYDPSKLQPSPVLVEKTYDPTNGAGIGGDIYRICDRDNANR